MLVVLVIIGILVLIALPNLMPLISKTPRAALQYNVKAYGLTKQEARVMEQLLINKYGLENLYNKKTP